MKWYRMTKLHVREDAENGKSAEDIRETNRAIYEHYGKMDGFISGGTWAVEEGDSHEGRMDQPMEVGKPIFLNGFDNWFRSSPLRS